MNDQICLLPKHVLSSCTNFIALTSELVPPTLRCDTAFLPTKIFVLCTHALISRKRRWLFVNTVCLCYCGSLFWMKSRYLRKLLCESLMFNLALGFQICASNGICRSQKKTNNIQIGISCWKVLDSFLSNCVGTVKLSGTAFFLAEVKCVTLPLCLKLWFKAFCPSAHETSSSSLIFSFFSSVLPMPEHSL